jgi:hypothetical protein
MAKAWHQRRVSHKVAYSLLFLAVIAVAIPLTVLMNQQQTNTQQHASSVDGSDIFWTADKQLGKPYTTIVSLTAGPNSFDCSGLVYYVYQVENGINIGGRLRAIDYYKYAGSSESLSNVKEGDLLFFSDRSDRLVNHVAIYYENGTFINAAKSFGKVIISSLDDHKGGIASNPTYRSMYIGAKRIIGVNPAVSISFSTSVPYSSTVKLNSSGNLVKILQRDLNDLGYGTLTVDGSFGQATQNAVKKFQTNYGLKVDGVVGTNTWSSINSALEYPGFY